MGVHQSAEHKLTPDTAPQGSRLPKHLGQVCQYSFYYTNSAQNLLLGSETELSNSVARSLRPSDLSDRKCPLHNWISAPDPSLLRLHPRTGGTPGREPRIPQHSPLGMRHQRLQEVTSEKLKAIPRK